MALSQSDRIAISKKIVSIPLQNAQADAIKAQLEADKNAAQQEDAGNQALMDTNTPLINAYQAEIQRYDGNTRVQLTEQMILDSSEKTFQNNFFPNDPQTSLPNVPSGVWKNFVAFSGNAAIGKNYNEGYTSTQKEQDLIDAINAQITIIEGLVDATRSSGNEVISNPSPPPDYLTQSSTTMQNAATAMISAVSSWESFLNATSALIPDNITDPDVSRSAENDAARDDITSAIAVIDTWQALQDFDTTTVTPTTQPDFDNFAASNFDPSKFRSTELQPLKDEITARQTFITTRISQIEGHLGSVTQDFSTGEIQAATGWYGNRFRFIDMRLNLMGGSLSKLKSLQSAQGAQDQAKQSNNNAASAYASVMVATAFRAPAAGTTTIHVLDASGFSPSDSVYVIADKQQEIAATIQSISGNRVVLSVAIPKKYRETESARLYKVL